ncbi:MAG: VWA domain-containing protein [Ruminococcaceae bacterium]|nr:VWA domain-containing protein [Oscillospiraceae bacterium]
MKGLGKMANKFKRIVSAFLTVVMCISLFSVPAFAETEATTPATVWLGDNVNLNVEAGTDGYTYMLFGDIPTFYYYETSNHTVKKEVTGGGAVHVLALIDTVDTNGTWTPSGIYEYGKSNYDIVYCCDAETGSEAGDYYRRINLEDSEYFSEENAKKIRAILTNAYPFLSVEEAKAALKAAGFEQADELDRSELITATQAAVWSIANAGNGDSYDYNKTATTAQKNTWGGYLHDFSAEITNFADSTTSRKYSTPEGVGARIDALKAFYLNLSGVEAEDDQIVISKLEIIDTIPVVEKDGVYKVMLQMQVNRPLTENVSIQLYVNDAVAENAVMTMDASDVYTIIVEAKANEVIKAVVSGTQKLDKGVYFYSPKPQDVNGDGIATSREVSQNLVGVAEGETPVYAEANVAVVVDPITGDVSLKKINTYGKDVKGVTFELYVQSESGMIAVGTYGVNENGELSIENILPGTYELKEIKAPYGYTLPEEPIRFEVTSDGMVKVEESNYASIKDAATANEMVTSYSKDLTAEDLAKLYITQAPNLEITIALNPNEENTVTNSETINVVIGEMPVAGETVYDYTDVVVDASREVTTSVTEVETTINHNALENITGIQPALKFDRNDTADQTAKKKALELYTDNGHFHDPASFTVTDAPEGYPWKYVGHGDYSGHYVSHVKVIYERDELGNALKDADGNYIIKELQHVSSGTPLYYNGELVTNPEGPFHYATGTRPQQFLLMNEKGETMYGYCIDLETGAESSTWYAMANLEDNDYYASEEAENHVRNIVMNGYWGTENGVGSLASLKEALKAAVASNSVDVEQDVTLVNRKKFTDGYELQEGEYHHGNYVYWSLPTEHVVLTNEIIDQMTEGEALDAMQAAIWSWANGSNATLDGTDRAIVGDMYAASSQLSDSLNGKNDPEGAARTKALYQYLMSLNAPLTTSVIINDNTFAENMTLTIGDKTSENTYAAELKFTIEGERNANDNLKVVLTYNGGTIELPLTGENAAVAENGYYTISGITLTAGVPFEFSLKITGEQYLEKGAYIFTSQGGTNASQTMVTMAEGTKSVDVAKSMSIVFNVEDSINGKYTRHWSDSKTLLVENIPPHVEWNPGEVSNISFMLIDKETGEIEWLYKKDAEEFDGNSAEIPAEEGKISAIFMKQGNEQGMFWFSEEVSEDIVNKTIDLVDEKNPSYKGYSTVAFGEGDHSYEFKNGKIITYTFTFGGSSNGSVEFEPEDNTTGDGNKDDNTNDDVITDTDDNTGDDNNDVNINDDVITEGGDNEDVIEPENPSTQPGESEDDEIGTKTSEKIEGERYEIEISVPGKGDIDNSHDEVILMVDGSYSMDNEWPAMKEAINTIGATVLNGSGNTQLTLMAFGMGDNEVLVHVKDANELAAALGELPGNLLYGRSSTNCEAGFTGVAEYIANHDETLKDVHVIFISDGNVNTDETPRAFDANWKEWSTQFGSLTVAQAAFEGSVANGENLPAAFTTVFGDRFDDATREDILARAFGGEVTEEEFFAFAEQLWTDVYAYSGLTRGVEYPVSDAERAFVKYDKENGTYIQDLFYYTTYKSAYVTYGDRWTRTPAAADALAAMDEVEAMYVVDYDSYTSWMDTGITSEKSTFVQSNGIAGLCDALSGALTELAKTPFNDVVVTDYMSKWVNLDDSTLKIVDNITGETIWSAAEGWLTENRPTAQEVPVVVELVDSANYADGGVDVIGNTSGDIYKLTWYVKDGAMLRSDNYSLKYEVTVDTAENGFQYNRDYPANGNTDLKYTDENGTTKGNPIEVPDVNAVKEIYTVEWDSGKASNISFMLIDKATGEVEFLKKYDIGNETSFEIPTEAGKISAVFIKQSTSGMFWFSEEVDEDIVDATIACLKANNPSYKGYNAIAFGAGDHTLEFKKNKFATYRFNGSFEIVGEEPVADEYVVDESVVEEPTVNEPVADEFVVEAPTPIKTKKVYINGVEAKAENTKVVAVDCLAVYVPAEGKVPAFIWVENPGFTTEAVAAFGADSSITVASGNKVDIKYQHNKNKTKTASYTFEIVEE